MLTVFQKIFQKSFIQPIRSRLQQRILLISIVLLKLIQNYFHLSLTFNNTFVYYVSYVTKIYNLIHPPSPTSLSNFTWLWINNNQTSLQFKAWMENKQIAISASENRRHWHIYTIYLLRLSFLHSSIPQFLNGHCKSKQTTGTPSIQHNGIHEI